MLGRSSFSLSVLKFQTNENCNKLSMLDRDSNFIIPFGVGGGRRGNERQRASGREEKKKKHKESDGEDKHYSNCLKIDNKLCTYTCRHMVWLSTFIAAPNMGAESLLARFVMT
jgi:hypothetical protein